MKFYPRYLINKNGEVFDSEKLVTIKHTINKTGYPAVTIRDEELKRGITKHVHRLLAINFIPTNGKGLVQKLQVNHIDGIKTNFKLSNLEWVTQQENCDHAYRNNLRTDNTPVKITNINTNEVLIVHSIGEAGRIFNTCPANIFYRMQKSNEPKIYKHCMFEYLNDIKNCKDPLKSNF
jgi:hypothetical protein